MRLSLILLSIAAFGDWSASHAIKNQVVLEDSPQSIDSFPDATLAIPTGTPSSSPFQSGKVTNEPLWLGWLENGDLHKERTAVIRDAYSELGWLIYDLPERLTPDEHGDFPGQASFARWFKNNDVAIVRDVYQKMRAGKEPGMIMSPEIATMVNVEDDWMTQCYLAAAYTDPATGYFHFCNSGLTGYTTLEYKRDNLKGLCEASEYRSMGKWAKSPSSIFLHELTHWDTIKGTDDVEHGESAWECFNLPAPDQLNNAENYALLALELFFSDWCPDVIYQDPREE